jgi:transcriptional regulator with XRE-family HTH domain
MKLWHMDCRNNINQLKVVLVEHGKSAKWLAEQLGKDPATVSKWCTNTSQPSLETLTEIARVLEVDIRELLCSTKSDTIIIKVPEKF